MASNPRLKTTRSRGDAEVSFQDLSDSLIEQPKMTNRTFRRDIQILRGLAVAAVMVFHAKERLFPNGYLGVDIFFVISGFVVMPLIQEIFAEGQTNYTDNFKQFLKRRFKRLAPALATTLITSTVLIYLFGSLSEVGRFARQGIATLFVLGNVGAFKYSGGYFLPNPNPLIHTWSLSVEEQIYFTFPIILLVLSFLKFNLKRHLVEITMVVSTLSFSCYLFPVIWSSGLEYLSINYPPEFSFYSPFARFWQFGLGAIASVVAQKSEISFGKLGRVIFFLPIIIFLPFSYDQNVITCTVTLLCAAILVCSDLKLEPNPFLRFLSWMGDRSYSIYLIHMPLIYLARHSPLLDSVSKTFDWILLLLALIISTIYGHVSYGLIENRYRAPSFRMDELSDIATIWWHSVLSFTLFPMLILATTLISFENGIPVNLNKPIPDNVRPYDWDSNCKFMQDDMDKDPEKFNFCLYSTPHAKSNYLLIGDSHAASLSKTMIRIAKTNGANLYIGTHASCRFLMKSLLTLEKFPSVSESCYLHNLRIAEFLRTNRINVIFYSQRSTFLEPNEVKMSLNRRVLRDLNRLPLENIRLIFVGITPEYAYPDNVLQVLMGDPGKFRSAPKTDNQFFRRRLMNNSKIEYLDVYKSFCDSRGDCHPREGAIWYFVDDNHLSLAGSEYLRGRITSQLNFIS